MHVHIVTKRWQSDRILPRLARMLMELPGYTIDQVAEPNADINYFCGYLQHGKGADVGGSLTAAWMTHKPPGKGKSNKWHYVKRVVDLRVVTVQQYADDLIEYGPTVKVTPGLELDLFVPGRKRTRKPIVGISGFVYKNQRKGEHLIEQLLEHPLYEKIQLRATGKGWPIPTQTTTLQHLPLFYQGLQVFLCTSLVEGVPYPPLEALACGVKVVIPRGVGLLDELPEVDGIVRYEAGNFDEMVQALDYSLYVQSTADELRDVVASRFTVDAWQATHHEAFEFMLDNHRDRYEYTYDDDGDLDG